MSLNRSSAMPEHWRAESRPRRSLLALLGLAVACFLFWKSAQILTQGWESYQARQSTRSWIPVEAEVKQCGYRAQLEPPAGDSSQDVRYYISLLYKYFVGKKLFRSSWYSHQALPSFDVEEAAQRFTQDYAPGKKLTVYYNPEKPGEAVVVKADPKEKPVFLIGGGCVLVSALMLFLYSWKWFSSCSGTSAEATE